MNIHSTTKRILLYGDSLVYGKTPGQNKRWRADTRFSGVLQKELGTKYEIIEEGLRARNLKGENSFFTERDGLAQFGPIIGSHLGVDVIVLALGTNDCNATGNVDATLVTEALDAYRKKIADWSTFLNVPEPKLLVVIPPAINPSGFDSTANTIFGSHSERSQQQLENTMVSYCQSNEIPYLQASTVCKPAKLGDGIHLDEGGNKKLGEALVPKIISLIG